MEYMIGFMGSAGRGKELPEDLLQLAQKTGEVIAKNHCILITGACMGTPYEATKSALLAGGKAIWFSPARDINEHVNPPISYPAPLLGCEINFTGLGKVGRIIPMISVCDVVIFCAGHAGTLVEFSVAYHEAKVIGYLEGSGGIADQIPELVKIIAKDTGALVMSDQDPACLVDKMKQLLNQRRKK